MVETKFDSLIFDMDGTLWDAVDTYCEIWNETYRRMCVRANVTRKMLIECMGMPIEQIIMRIAPDGLDRDRFVGILRQVDAEIMPRDGGRLYDGVAELIPRLAQRFTLLMVSNCGKYGLDYFLDYTRLRPYFADTLTHGETGLPKDGNIVRLMERHGLKRSIYIGDTAGDCRSAHVAGIPMMHVGYGFGSCDDADYYVNSFYELAGFFSL